MAPRWWHRGTRALAAVTAGLALGTAWASPTSDEFRHCHRVAAAALQFCLDKNPGGRHGEACWTQSRRQQQACYREVRESHRRPGR
ncbi:hypothetical protein JNX00_08460 [Hydrogenophaga sp. YM1]|uniref:hypothetical protein n=1 Tax=Hydrogenophaga sp. YM1 TaxID=2806262 RepID=UPI00195D0FD9|nr:hypothetical protein [Hydrogenophaga sp. YM1]QRR35877.1 hypothetical protein JNX00_08460 [Hydrogenophaga sp. YM1]